LHLAINAIEEGAVARIKPGGAIIKMKNQKMRDVESGEYDEWLVGLHQCLGRERYEGWSWV